MRLGEIDFALRLPKLPFARRIDELDRIVASRAAAIRRNPPAAAPEPRAPTRREPRCDTGLHSGPHPVAA